MRRKRLSFLMLATFLSAGYVCTMPMDIQASTKQLIKSESIMQAELKDKLEGKTEKKEKKKEKKESVSMVYGTTQTTITTATTKGKERNYVEVAVVDENENQEKDSFVVIERQEDESPWLFRDLDEMSLYDENLIPLMDTSEDSLDLNASSITVVMADSVKETKIPVEYVAYCYEIAKQYHLPPELIIAIIESESSGHPLSISSSGACGLMQIMPNWHMQRMQRLGVEDIFDPYGNILLGTDYMKQLITSYKNLEMALMRYNGTGQDTAYELLSNDSATPYAIRIVNRMYELEYLHGTAGELYQLDLESVDVEPEQMPEPEQVPEPEIMAMDLKNTSKSEEKDESKKKDSKDKSDKRDEDVKEKKPTVEVGIKEVIEESKPIKEEPSIELGKEENDSDSSEDTIVNNEEIIVEQ